MAQRRTGLGSVENPDLTGHSSITTSHKKGLEALVMDAQPVNPEMPFSSRNFGGKWQFVMDNLGAGENGCVVENKRRNKGQFIADSSSRSDRSTRVHQRVLPSWRTVLRGNLELQR